MVSTALTARPGTISGIAVDKRQHAALAQGHADDFVFAGLQGSRSVDDAAVIVTVAKLGLGQETEFAFIENENIDEVEQFVAELSGRRRIEDRRRAGRTGALEEGVDRGQGNLELADRDVALRKRRRGDVGGINQRIRAWE